MTRVSKQVEEWKQIFTGGSIAEKLFTLEELNNHLEEYTFNDITHIKSSLFETLLTIFSNRNTPDEIVLIMASIFTKIRRYIVDDGDRQRVFIQGSNHIDRFLKSYKHARIITDLMSAYQKKEGK